MADKFAPYEVKTRMRVLTDERDDNNMILAEARFFPFPHNVRQHQQKAVQPKTFSLRWNYPFHTIGLLGVKSKHTVMALHDTSQATLELKHFTTANLALHSGKAKVKLNPTFSSKPPPYSPCFSAHPRRRPRQLLRHLERGVRRHRQQAHPGSSHSLAELHRHKLLRSPRVSHKTPSPLHLIT